MKIIYCRQQIKWTNSRNIIIENTMLSIASREKKATNEQIQTTHTKDENQAEWMTLNKKIDELEKKLNNINISDIKEQPKPSSGQRRQSSANRQSSFKIPREQIYEVLGEAKKDALQTMHNK